MMIIIREARIDDVGELREIYNWAVKNTAATFDLEEVSMENRRNWFCHYNPEHHPLIVAELEISDKKKVVVGYSSLSEYREKAAYSKTVELSVYVHPDYHNQGIGKKLVTEIINRAKILGYHTILSGITAGNDASIKMHEKFGFQFIGNMKQVGFKFGKWQDVLFYQLML